MSCSDALCIALTGYLSAVCHDLDHKGLNNDFLVKSADALAIEYNDLSPLENHHLAQSFRLLTRPDCNVLSHLSKEKQVPCDANSCFMNESKHGYLNLEKASLSCC